jgi:hypothetical protein
LAELDVETAPSKTKAPTTTNANARVGAERYLVKFHSRHSRGARHAIDSHLDDSRGSASSRKVRVLEGNINAGLQVGRLGPAREKRNPLGDGQLSSEPASMTISTLLVLGLKYLQSVCWIHHAFIARDARSVRPLIRDRGSSTCQPLDPRRVRTASNGQVEDRRPSPDYRASGPRQTGCESS